MAGGIQLAPCGRRGAGIRRRLHIIEAYGDGDVILLCGTRNSLEITGSYLIFDGGLNRQLIVDGSTQSGGGEHLIYPYGPSTEYVTLSRLVARDNGKLKSRAIADEDWSTVSVAGYGNYLKIYNSEVYGSYAAGIYGGMGDYQEVKNNIVHDNCGVGIQYNPHDTNADYKGKTIASSDEITISGNLVYNNGHCWTDEIRPGITILSNINTLYDIYVYNNIIWGNKVAGIETSNYNNIRARIYGNTIFNNTDFGLLIKTEDIIIKNNIIYGNGPSGSADFSISAYNNRINYSSIDFKNNLVGTLKNTHSDLSQFAIGNIIATNPQFISTNSVSSDYLKFSSTSPAIDSGTSIPLVTTDFFGTPRPQGTGYDIGAYEYPAGGGGDTTPPSAPTGVMVI